MGTNKHFERHWHSIDQRMRASLAVTAGLSLVLSALPAATNAQGVGELRLGALTHDIDNLWAHARKEHGTDINIEFVFAQPLFELGPGVVRPNIGASLNSSGDTSKAYAGVVWQVEHDSGWFFETGVGAAIHTGETDARRPNQKRLGSRLLFRIPLEAGYSPDDKHRISMMFDHISNAYLASPNEGLDTLGLRYGYRF